MELDEYRAIKQVSKSRVDYEQFRKEALILKSIRHPGMPIVYDLEDTADYSYMILEFLEGDSLYALVSSMGHFSKAVTIRYGIQICHLVYILHSRPTPILYLDLQPKNLLVCHDVVKLIDFDHSVHLDEAETLTQRYGTIGCAAPEQYTGDILDERTDIYAIGAVLYYMLTGTYPELPFRYPKEPADRNLMRVIRTCLQTDKSKRYTSVEALAEALDEIRKKMEKAERSVWKNSQISSLTIAAAGAGPGVGTTHIAMGFTAYLRRQGLPVLYEEKNESGAVRQFADSIGAHADRCGIFVLKGVSMLPAYGEAVKLSPHPYRIVVRDYGSQWRKCLEDPADGYLFICGGKPWETEHTRALVSDPGIQPGHVVIYNHFNRQLCEKLPGPAKGTDCFLMPYFPNPLRAAKAANQVYEAVFRSLTGKGTGGILRNLPGKIRVLATRIFRERNGEP